MKLPEAFLDPEKTRYFIEANKDKAKVSLEEIYRRIEEIRQQCRKEKSA